MYCSCSDLNVRVSEFVFNFSPTTKSKVILRQGNGIETVWRNMASNLYTFKRMHVLYKDIFLF